ncbi:hypothetical protein H634G_09252 [Metarhizium anisopliae BRIP 53293]|uniref:Glycoside hydrolase 131 catalytic N-terminal domain-containing protein n=1 Tax=Metarhizium anisopliae BRIP 53293 TaxID=1291518 RepID=A0A0D9NP94_METAN|nr:hypothetical protein H634G_09252 [Metarhizium anisopliae BRIP 53293]KJK89112.1 hypothetical protein H633G_07030 [Metarhizium anisopliae BRIP 53284]
MHFMPSIAVVLVFGTGSSFSWPTLAVGGPLANVPTFEDADFDTNTVIKILGQKKKNAAKSPTYPTPITKAPAIITSTPSSNNTVLRIKGENNKKIKTNGFFGSPNSVQGGFLFTKINMPSNAVGNLEVEYNGTEANTILVAPKMANTQPPTGMVFVDPMTFMVSTEKPPVTGDTLKIDYIFTEAVKSAVDPSLVRVGKLDTANNQWVTDGLGEFEFEKEENEWSQEVSDLNGEWGIFAPVAAGQPGQA